MYRAIASIWNSVLSPAFRQATGNVLRDRRVRMVPGASPHAWAVSSTLNKTRPGYDFIRISSVFICLIKVEQVCVVDSFVLGTQP